MSKSKSPKLDDNYNVTSEPITIDEHLNTRYREFSHYVLQQRGIPLVTDSLINVQRVILTHAPEKMNPTMHLIGACSPYYHHGDSSLQGAIARLARTFDNSYPLLTGSGFFGNGLAEAASARYTKCRASDDIRAMIRKYRDINEMDLEGAPKFLNLDVPIGLCTTVLGIGIGYQSQILPRKFEEMAKYLDGKPSDLNPHFMDFKGTIEPTGPNSWLISSKITVDAKLGVVHIEDLPPMMRYDTFINKLAVLADESDFGIKVINNSKTYVDVQLKCKVNVAEKLKLLVNKIIKNKIASISIKENLVFTDNHGIVQYNDITDYLDDFKVYRNVSRLKLLEFELYELKYEQAYSLAHIEFVKFLTTQTRTNADISEYLGTTLPAMFPWQSDKKMSTRIVDRLRSIPAWKATNDEIEASKTWVINLKTQIENKTLEIEKFRKSNNFILKSKGNNLLKISS